MLRANCLYQVVEQPVADLLVEATTPHQVSHYRLVVEPCRAWSWGENSALMVEVSREEGHVPKGWMRGRGTRLDGLVFLLAPRKRRGLIRLCYRPWYGSPEQTWFAPGLPGRFVSRTKR